MRLSPFALIYLLGLSVASAILWKHARQRTRAPIQEDFTTPLDRALTALTSLGMFFLPLVHLTTPHLAWADYRLGAWAILPGAGLFSVAIWLLWRAHMELGRFWSAGLQIRQGQFAIMSGVFRHIRHPIYAAYFLWGLAQPWLIHNWIAGFSLLATFLPVYLYRVGREERMMKTRFPEYALYIERTDRLWPAKRLAYWAASKPARVLRWLKRG